MTDVITLNCSTKDTVGTNFVQVQARWSNDWAMSLVILVTLFRFVPFGCFVLHLQMILLPLLWKHIEQSHIYLSKKITSESFPWMLHAIMVLYMKYMCFYLWHYCEHMSTQTWYNFYQITKYATKLILFCYRSLCCNSHLTVPTLLEWMQELQYHLKSPI